MLGKIKHSIKILGRKYAQGGIRLKITKHTVSKNGMRKTRVGQKNGHNRLDAKAENPAEN